ncbi:MAG: hypothetical protein GTO02_04340 [Candidatus Dadabacteria bacterium]|nr:hypothetical protein [Candidatus Dadabacteria bacterium]
MNQSIERVKYKNSIIAIIIRSDYNKEGIEFFTPNEFSQQLGYIKHPKGKIIPPHVHNPVPREVQYTQEVLLVRKGKVKIDFYTQEKVYSESRILNTGDVILLASGGHGFTMLESTEMIEVKQGPFTGNQDKTRFEGIK